MYNSINTIIIDLKSLPKEVQCIVDEFNVIHSSKKRELY